MGNSICPSDTVEGSLNGKLNSLDCQRCLKSINLGTCIQTYIVHWAIGILVFIITS